MLLRGIIISLLGSGLMTRERKRIVASLAIVSVLLKRQNVVTMTLVYCMLPSQISSKFRLIYKYRNRNYYKIETFASYFFPKFHIVTMSKL